MRRKGGAWIGWHGAADEKLKDDTIVVFMTDNGFGGQTNSADTLLRLYSVRPDFRTASGGSGNANPGSSSNRGAARVPTLR